MCLGVFSSGLGETVNQRIAGVYVLPVRITMYAGLTCRKGRCLDSESVVEVLSKDWRVCYEG